MEGLGQEFTWQKGSMAGYQGPPHLVSIPIILYQQGNASVKSLEQRNSRHSLLHSKVLKEMTCMPGMFLMLDFVGHWKQYRWGV